MNQNFQKKIILSLLQSLILYIFIVFNLYSYQSASLLSGFSFSWKNLPHRINEIGILDGECKLVGGDWGAIDNPSCCITKKRIESSRIAFFEISSFDTLSGSLKWNLEKKKFDEKIAEDYRELSVDLKETGLNNFANITVIINGFHFDVTNPVMGLTANGISAKIVDQRQEGDLLTIHFYSKLRAGVVPDRFQNLEKYDIHHALDFLIIGFNDGVEENIKIDKIIKNKKRIKKAILDSHFLQKINRRYRNYLLGLSGFDISIKAIKPFNTLVDDNLGFYVRRFSLMYDKIIDGNDLLLRSKTNLEFTNTGIFTRKTEAHFQIDLKLIQLNDPTLLTNEF